MVNKLIGESLLKDQIYKYVSMNVQDGFFLPNAKLSEESIASALNVSRTPVREALTQLASEGYIEKIPHRGFYVREWSNEEKRDTYEFISFLDFLCAKRAIKYLNEDDILKMREYIAKMDVAIEFKNYTDYVKTQLKFHYVYIEKCHNNVLIKNIEKLLYSPMPVTYSLKLPNDELFELFYQCNIDHKEIMQCFINKDINKLEELIARHWNNYAEETV